MNLAVGSRPFRPLHITVRDGSTLVDMHVYTGLELVMTGPEGDTVPTTGGTLTVATDGSVLYTWPASGTLFPTAGDYRVRLKATAPNALDWTSAATIEVFPLEA